MTSPVACRACGVARETDQAQCWACGTLLEAGDELVWRVEYNGVELMLPARWREVTRDHELCRWQSENTPESVVLSVLEPEDPSKADLAGIAQSLATGALANADRSSVQWVDSAYERRHVVEAIGFSSAEQMALATRVVACPTVVAVVLHALELSAPGAPAVGLLAVDPALEAHRQGILQSVVVVDGG